MTKTKTCGEKIVTKDKRPPLVCVLPAEHVLEGKLHETATGEHWGGIDIPILPPE